MFGSLKVSHDEVGASAEKAGPDFPGPSHEGVAVGHHEVVHHEVIGQPQDVADELATLGRQVVWRGLESCVARWQNLIPSFPWIAPGWRAWGHNPRKGRDQNLQHSGAMVLQAQRAKHIQYRNPAIAIWQPCSSPGGGALL